MAEIPVRLPEDRWLLARKDAERRRPGMGGGGVVGGGGELRECERYLRFTKDANMRLNMSDWSVMTAPPVGVACDGREDDGGAGAVDDMYIAGVGGRRLYNINIKL